MRNVIKLTIIASLVLSLLQGCSNIKTLKSESEFKPPKIISTTSASNLTNKKEIVLADSTLSPTPYCILNNKTLISSNKPYNNRIVYIDMSSLDVNTYINTLDANGYNDITEPYSTNLMTSFGTKIYFVNSIDNTLYEIDFTNKKVSKTLNIPVNNIIATKDKIFFRQLSSKTEGIYYLDIKTNKITCLTTDNSERFLINGSYIIYLNKSNRFIYLVNMDSLEIKQISNIAADSFAVCNKEIYFITNGKNNSLYRVNTANFKTDLVMNLTAQNLSSDGSNLYYIKTDSLNTLMKITFSQTKEPIITQLSTSSINDYFILDKYLFFDSPYNTETIQFFKLE